MSPNHTISCVYLFGHPDNLAQSQENSLGFVMSIIGVYINLVGASLSKPHSSEDSSDFCIGPSMYTTSLCAALERK